MFSVYHKSECWIKLKMQRTVEHDGHPQHQLGATGPGSNVPPAFTCGATSQETGEPPALPFGTTGLYCATRKQTGTINVGLNVKRAKHNYYAQDKCMRKINGAE